MMQFWIGDSQEYLAVEYAKSGRSTCRQCKQKIGKDELRIGLLTDSDQMPLSLWHHLNCFHFKPRHKSLENEQMIEMVYGIDDLDADDCDKVLAYLEEELKNFVQNKYTKKGKGKKGAGAKKEESSDGDGDKEDGNFQIKKSKGNMKKSKTETKQKQEKTQKISRTGSKAEEKKKSFMSPEQEKLYQEYYEKFFACTAKKNSQPKTGAKDVLAWACADGKLLGRIPNCPKCAGGKLRFDRENGTYKCPGYMEDTEFKHCKATFSFDEIKRLQWIE